VSYPVNYTISGNANPWGYFSIDVKGLPLPGDCTSSTGVSFSDGKATLTDSAGTIQDGGWDFEPAVLVCNSGPPPTGKTFSIGLSAMEGGINVRPGDWVSGGYSFAFATNNHAATTVTVAAT